MKKLKLLKTASLALAAIVLASCAGTPQKTQDTGPFTLYKWSESVPASEGSSGEGSLELSFVLADTEDASLRELASFLLYGGRTAEEYAKKVAADWRVSYANEISEDAGWGVSEDWSYAEKHAISLAGNFAVIVRDSYQYQGGAHPDNQLNYFVLCTAPVSRVEIEDVFPRERRSHISKMLDAGLRKFAREKLKEDISDSAPLSSAGFDIIGEVPIPEDFCPTKEGIVFHWNPYDIAAYAAGPIDIKISWDELEGDLSAAGKLLEAAFRN
jgi:hypothetical protein